MRTGLGMSDTWKDNSALSSLTLIRVDVETGVREYCVQIGLDACEGKTACKVRVFVIFSLVKGSVK
jgi:hypothetical protein